MTGRRPTPRPSPACETTATICSPASAALWTTPIDGTMTRAFRWSHAGRKLQDVYDSSAGGRDAAASRAPRSKAPDGGGRVGWCLAEAREQRAGVGEAHAEARPLRANLAVDCPQHGPAPAERHQCGGDRRVRPDYCALFKTNVDRVGGVLDRPLWHRLNRSRLAGRAYPWLGTGAGR